MRGDSLLKRPFRYSLFLFFILILLLKSEGLIDFARAEDKDFHSSFDKKSTLLPPSYLTALDEKDGVVPLYWFEPSLLPETLCYDNGIKKTGMYVNVEWFDNRFAVRITPPSSPFLLLNTEVFICYDGSSGDDTYNFSQPFFISINKDSGGIPGAFISAPVDTYATGRDISFAEGEWVEVEHNLLFLDSTDFWIVFHWEKDFPLSPLVGVDSSPNCGRSYKGWRKNGYWEWEPLSYNLMMRAQIICNGQNTFSLKKFSPPDSFRIYRSKNPDDLTSSMDYLSVLDLFQYDDTDVENGQTYYYKVTAWYGGEESKPSNEVKATPKKGAELWINKDFFEVNLGLNQTKVENLLLKNNGGISLDFFVKIDTDFDSSYGGKDYFGYLWTDSDKKQDLTFLWIDTEDETVVSDSGDDNEIYGPVPLGFSFPFYGNLFDSLYINTNGWVSLTYSRMDSARNMPLPSSIGPFNLLALFWDDLKVTDSSEISYYSGQDTFVVNFKKLAHWFFGGSYTFQGILTKDGKIVFNYQVMNGIIDSATIGIQNENGSFALPVVFNQEYVHDSLTLEIIPSWIKVEPRAEIILPSDSLTLSLSFDSRFLLEGLFLSELIIEAKDKNHNLDPLIIPINLKVDSSTWVEEEVLTNPISFSLSQNYPNPFNPHTAIPFSVHGSQKTVNSPIPATGKSVHEKRKTINSPVHTTLKIYNIRGQLVRTLVDGLKRPGEHVVIWDGKDEKCRSVSSGIYFYQLKVGERKVTKKMIKLK